MKKKVSTLYAPFVIVWNRNCFSTIFRSSILSEYLKTMMHVWPKMTQAIEMARKPCMDGMVSLPTLRSQMARELVITENDNNSSSQISIRTN